MFFLWAAPLSKFKQLPVLAESCCGSAPSDGKAVQLKSTVIHPRVLELLAWTSNCSQCWVIEVWLRAYKCVAPLLSRWHPLQGCHHHRYECLAERQTGVICDIIKNILKLWHSRISSDLYFADVTTDLQVGIVQLKCSCGSANITQNSNSKNFLGTLWTGCFSLEQFYEIFHLTQLLREKYALKFNGSITTNPSLYPQFPQQASAPQNSRKVPWHMRQSN